MDTLGTLKTNYGVTVRVNIVSAPGVDAHTQEKA